LLPATALKKIARHFLLLSLVDVPAMDSVGVDQFLRMPRNKSKQETG